MSALFRAESRLNATEANLIGVALAVEALETLLVARGLLKEGEVMDTLKTLAKAKGALNASVSRKEA